MNFCVESNDLDRLMMSYLRDRGYFDSLTALQLQLGINDDPKMSGESIFLQKIVLEGKWDDVFSYLKPLRKYITYYDQAELSILRQKYLESLSWQGAGGQPQFCIPWHPHLKSNSGKMMFDDLDDDNTQPMEEIVKLLKRMEAKCPPKEFSSLCLCLTLQDLRENPDFSTWSVSKGRLEVFQSLHGLIGKLVISGTEDVNLHESSLNNSKTGLLALVSMGLSLQLLQCQQRINVSEILSTISAAAGDVCLTDGKTIPTEITMSRTLKISKSHKQALDELRSLPQVNIMSEPLPSTDDDFTALNRDAMASVLKRIPSSPDRSGKFSKSTSPENHFNSSKTAYTRQEGSLSIPPTVKVKPPVAWVARFDEDKGRPVKSASVNNQAKGKKVSRARNGNKSKHRQDETTEEVCAHGNTTRSLAADIALKREQEKERRRQELAAAQTFTSNSPPTSTSPHLRSNYVEITTSPEDERTGRPQVMTTQELGPSLNTREGLDERTENANFLNSLSEDTNVINSLGESDTSVATSVAPQRRLTISGMVALSPTREKSKDGGFFPYEQEPDSGNSGGSGDSGGSGGSSNSVDSSRSSKSKESENSETQDLAKISNETVSSFPQRRVSVSGTVSLSPTRANVVQGGDDGGPVDVSAFESTSAECRESKPNPLTLLSRDSYMSGTSGQGASTRRASVIGVLSLSPLASTPEDHNLFDDGLGGADDHVNQSPVSKDVNGSPERDISALLSGADGDFAVASEKMDMELKDFPAPVAQLILDKDCPLRCLSVCSLGNNSGYIVGIGCNDRSFRLLSLQSSVTKISSYLLNCYLL